MSGSKASRIEVESYGATKNRPPSLPGLSDKFQAIAQADLGLLLPSPGVVGLGGLCSCCIPPHFVASMRPKYVLLLGLKRRGVLRFPRLLVLVLIEIKVESYRF